MIEIAEHSQSLRGKLYVATVLIVWFVLAFVLNVAGIFRPDPMRPPLVFLLAVVGPPLLFAGAYWMSANVREFVLNLDLRLMTAIQAWRIVGVMFLILYVYGLLPGTFAWPAGLGDIVVGVYAPFVAVAIAKQTAGWEKHAVLLNVLGLVDFVGAVGSGVLSGGTPAGILAGGVTTDIMQRLPLSLIPTFAVPFWIILHCISLLQLRRIKTLR